MACTLLISSNNPYEKQMLLIGKYINNVNDTASMKLKLSSLEKSSLVESVIQFGSSLESKKYNDIDLCIFTTKKISLKQKLALQRELPEEYDVSFYQDLSISLKKEVLSKGKIIFTKNYLRILRQIPFIEDEYVYYKKFLDEYHKARMAKL